MAETLDLGNGYSLSFDESAAAEAVERVRVSYEKLKADASVQAMLAKAETVEEVYDALISHINCTLDEFRALFDEVAHKTYEAELAASGTKEELTEEELDVVAGGGFWSWLKKNWVAVTEIAVGVAVTVGSVVAGGLTGQPGFFFTAIAGVGIIADGACRIK